MVQADKQFYLEVTLTFILMVLVTFLFGAQLLSFSLFVILSTVFGLVFSLTNTNRPFKLINSFITAAILVVIIWMAYSILNSSFLYSEVVLICAEAVFLLVAILSFNVTAPGIINYMQGLNIALFLCFPLFIRVYNEISIIIIGIYLFLCLAIIKIKFYKFFFRRMETEKINVNTSSALLVTVSILILLLSGMFFLLLSPKKFIPPELIAEGIWMKESMDQDMESEYYKLRDEFQAKATDLAFNLQEADRKFKAIGMVSNMIKESPVAEEVDKAENGLVSYLRTPGLGLEKGKEDFKAVMREYVDRTSDINMKRAREKMTNDLQSNPLNIKDRLAVNSLMNQIRKSDSFSETTALAKELKEEIDGSSFDSLAKKDLQESSSQYTEWKVFKLYHKSKDYDKVEELSDLAEASEEVQEQIQKEIQQSILSAARDVLHDATQGEIQGITREQAQDAAQDALREEVTQKLIQDVAREEASREQVQDAIQEAMQEGAAQEQVEKSIHDAFGQRATRDAIQRVIQQGITPEQLQEQLQEAMLGLPDGTPQDTVQEAVQGTIQDAIQKAIRDESGLGLRGSNGILQRVILRAISKNESAVSRPEDRIEDGKMPLADKIQAAMEKEAEERASEAQGEGGSREQRQKGLEGGLMGGDRPFAIINIAWATNFIMWLIITAIFILIMLWVIASIVLFVLTEIKRRRLISLSDNPREFIIRLFENLRQVLSIIGIKNKQFLAPLSYADSVEKQYLIRDKLLSGFTAKFQEAKYSQHILDPQEAKRILGDYNDFLKMLSKNFKFHSLFLQNCLILFKRVPLFI